MVATATPTGSHSLATAEERVGSTPTHRTLMEAHPGMFPGGNYASERKFWNLAERRDPVGRRTPYPRRTVQRKLPVRDLRITSEHPWGVLLKPPGRCSPRQHTTRKG